MEKTILFFIPLLTVFIALVVIIAESAVFVDTGSFPYLLDNGTTNLSKTGTWVEVYSSGYYYKMYSLTADSNGTVYIKSYDSLVGPILPDPNYLVNVTDKTLGLNVSYNIVYVDIDGDKIWDYYWLVFNVTATHDYSVYYRWSGTLDLSYKVLLDNSTYNFTIDANVSTIYALSRTWYIVKFVNSVDDGRAIVDSKYVPLGINIVNVTEEFPNGTRRTINYIIRQGSIIVVFNASNGNTYYVYTYNETSLILSGGSAGATTSTTSTTTTANTTTNTSTGSLSIIGGGLGNLINKTKEVLEKVYVVVVERSDPLLLFGVVVLALLVLMPKNNKRRR